MNPPEVTPVTVGAAAPAAAPPAAAVPQVDAAALQREIDDLKAANAEQRRTAEFWYNKAAEKPVAPKPAAPAVDEEPEVDVLDLATKGGKAFGRYLDDWAKKNGYVRGDQMNAAISAKTAELTEQSQLIAEYPDLKNNKSEFFTATAQLYGELKEEGMSERRAMRIAAERVELRFLKEGKTKTPAQQAADDKAQKEADRRARSAAGGGDRGSRQSAEAEDDDTLDADQLAAVRHLADGLDISIEDATKRYIARAKQGVRMARRT